MCRWGLECLVARQSFVEARKVDVPRRMHRFWVLLPEAIHFIGIVRIGAIRKRVIWGRSAGESIPATEGNGEWTKRP